jgi:glycine betaine/choline ABC-type transport system substrate-binding protein
MDPGLMYQAIALNQVAAMMAYSTDARISEYRLITLQDDQHLFPPYQAALVVRNDFLQKHTEIKQALNPVLGKISNQIMQGLNYEVDVLKRSPETVAKNFLSKISSANERHDSIIALN